MPARPGLVRKLKAAIERHHMASPGDLWLVAVSGGADSVALMHALHGLASELRLRLHIAHLNHHLRGAAADADAAFVQDLAGRLGLPATIGVREVAGLEPTLGRGLEAAARQARYSFLAATTTAIGAAGVALGHTADDQAETVLLHLLRGAGLTGLRGMLPVSELSGLDPEGPAAGPWRVRLFRPFLEVTRQEVEEYCRLNSLPYRTDATNFDPSLQRNWVRHDLLPWLESRSPGVRQTLARSACLAAEDLAYLQDIAARAWPGVACEGPDGISFDLVAWRALHPVEQRYLLREAFRRCRGTTEDLTEAHLSAALAIIDGSQVGSTITWPHGLRLVKGYTDFRLTDEEPAGPSEPCPPPLSLAVPGVTSFGSWAIEAQVCPARDLTADPWHADLDYRRVCPPGPPALRVRARQPGDRMQPLGMASEKKLQDLMVEGHIPRRQRDSWPVVVSSGGDEAPTGRIVWVPGVRIADWARVMPDTAEVLRLRTTRPR